MAQTKREWHYQYFTDCGAFETWQANGNYERNITSIVPVPVCCSDPTVTGVQTSQTVMVTWWESPPGSIGHI